MNKIDTLLTMLAAEMLLSGIAEVELDLVTHEVKIAINDKEVPTVSAQDKLDQIQAVCDELYPFSELSGMHKVLKILKGD